MHQATIPQPPFSPPSPPPLPPPTPPTSSTTGKSSEGENIMFEYILGCHLTTMGGLTYTHTAHSPVCINNYRLDKYEMA